MIEKPLILGESPSKTGDRYHDFPLSGAVGKRLCELAGLAPEVGGSPYGQYYWPLREAFDCRNLVKRYPGPAERGFPKSLARERAIEVELPPVVVLLGVRLKDAFTHSQTLPFYKWCNYSRREAGQFTVQWDDSYGSSVVWPAGIDSIEQLTRDIINTHRMVVIPHPSSLNRMYNAGENHHFKAGMSLREALHEAEMAR